MFSTFIVAGLGRVELVPIDDVSAVLVVEAGVEGILEVGAASEVVDLGVRPCFSCLDTGVAFGTLVVDLPRPLPFPFTVGSESNGSSSTGSMSSSSGIHPAGIAGIAGLWEENTLINQCSVNYIDSQHNTAGKHII